MDSYNQIQSEAENFWKEYSYLLESSGNTSADQTQQAAYRERFNKLSPEARHVVEGWEQNGKDWVHTQNSYLDSLGVFDKATTNFVYDFAADSAMLEQISSEFSLRADEISGLITDIYAKINELSACWSGEAYNEFKTSCEQYRSALEGLVMLLEVFSKEFLMVRDNTSTLISKVSDELVGTGSAIGNIPDFNTYLSYFSSN